ncbi:hypothetical protein QA649_10700 [Bradyrhizobium sp. CB1717]|uniref:hypothetical protein n=1 Tax=Bradyrhizobium sp. CB1717 TaxID=3039154 RepID=UPI0024B1AEF2|nr:hypothetical protein [Bradyrhizobium sp. CB1717]WFU26644.1 hypothetical protein QA649_10700 [Bradyrhizobium sp. CB1717]
MSIAEATPIACTLAAGAYEDRLAWIAALNKDALRSHERRDLVLELHYAIEARARVHEMVRNEQSCCAFLTFQLHESRNDICLTITAPQAAREVADALFEQFVAKTPIVSSCACATSASAAKTPAEELPGSKAASVTAVTLSIGAVACGVCCVLPFALPAAMLASTGTLLAWFVSMHLLVTVLALLSVAGAWGWIVWQSRRTRRRPAPSTLVVMAGSTVLLAIAVLWPLIERPLIRALQA